MVNKDFAVFILTHGRPDNIKTLKALEAGNYTGSIYFIIDNEDKAADKYISNFGKDNVIVFDKKYYASLIDNADNFGNRKVITHARNASFDIAKKLGITYFMQLDDDYTSFLLRYERGLSIKNLDAVFDSFIDYYKTIPALSIAFSQGGDHIGGFSGTKLKRKCMNSFLCSTDRPFMFIGTMNEDVNTYVILGSRGGLFFTFTSLQLNQTATQSQKGGATDWFKDNGTYCKSFYTVMMQPSSVKVSMMTSKNERLHHSIDWDKTVPCILDEKYRKP